MPPRLSITKAQRQSEIATDLIDLLHTITSDGHLTNEEIAALRDWLNENWSADLPAITFLRETVERVLTDGVVTPDEQREVYLAIETVLPPDIRVSVRGSRVLRARVDREKAIADRIEAEERNEPIERLDFCVAGSRYEGRHEAVRLHARQGDVGYLIRERDNKFSKNAVEVRLQNGMMVGYVPEELAIDLAPTLDGGAKHRAHIKKLWQGKHSLIPIMLAEIYQRDADRPGAIAESAVPTRQLPPPSSANEPTGAAGARTGTGCVLLLAAIVGIVVVATLARETATTPAPRPVLSSYKP